METKERPILHKLTRPLLWIEVNTSHLVANLRALKGFTEEGVSIMAVVKANAYGHGLAGSVKAFEPEAAWFGVSALAEAIRMREAGISAPVLVFGHVPAEEIPLACEWEISLSVSDGEYGMLVASQARRTGRKARVHVKVDTGMGRFGLPWEDSESTILDLARTVTLDLEGLYTHFPQAARKRDSFTLGQIARFDGLRASLMRQGLEFPWLHAAGSAAIVNYPEAHFNLVRPGIMLYGLYPDPSFRDDIFLKPALALYAKWVLIKRVRRGESVGYDRTVMAGEDTTIGVLPMGYSHGYPFSLAGRATVVFRGGHHPLAGRVSMDSVAVNLGADGEAEIGDSVLVMGSEQPGVPVEELARLAGTIPYEIVTRLDGSIERIFKA